MVSDLEGKVGGRKNPAELIVKHIGLRGYSSRKEYLTILEEKGVIENVKSAEGKLCGHDSFPLYCQKIITDDLGISKEELVVFHGRNPYQLAPEEIEEFRSDEKGGFGKYLNWHIGLQKGMSRNAYFEYLKNKNAEDLEIKRGWFEGCSGFPLYYQKIITDDLGISKEELVVFHGRNPYQLAPEEIEEFRSDEKGGFGKYLNWHIGLQKGIKRKTYLRNLENEGTVENIGTAKHWFTGKNPFPLYYQKIITDDLGISREQLMEFHGRDPYKLTSEEIEEFRSDEKDGFKKYLNWHIGLQKGVKRQIYLKNLENEEVIGNMNTAKNWFTRFVLFPQDKLKLIVDDLELPYSEINQFLSYDIADAREKVINDEKYVDRLVGHVVDDEAIKAIYALAKNTGVDRDMAFCFSEIICANNPELLTRRMQVSEKLGEYFEGAGNAGDVPYSPNNAISALEDLFRTQGILANPPSNSLEPLVEVMRNTYDKQYGGQDVKLSEIVGRDIEKVGLDGVREILSEVRKDYEFDERMDREVYGKKIHATVKRLVLK